MSEEETKYKVGDIVYCRFFSDVAIGKIIKISKWGDGRVYYELSSSRDYHPLIAEEHNIYIEKDAIQKRLQEEFEENHLYLLYDLEQLPPLTEVAYKDAVELKEQLLTLSLDEHYKRSEETIEKFKKWKELRQ